MEALPLVKMVPEYGLTLNPSTGRIGSAFSMEDVNKEITKLEAAANDLINSLDPNTVSDGAYPGREGTYVTAGTLTNMTYGFLIGLFVLLVVILKLGVL